MPKIQDLQKIVAVYHEQLKTKLQGLIQEAYEDQDNEPFMQISRDYSQVAIFKRKFPDVNNKTAAYVTYPNATVLTNQIANLITTESNGKGYAIEGIEKKFITDLFHRDRAGYQDAALTQGGINFLTTQTKKGPQIDRLLHRFAAISELREDLKDKTGITPEIESQVNNTVQICQENRPTWSEKPFLDKLKDFFSLGITLIFYKDDAEEFVENVENVKPSPKSR